MRPPYHRGGAVEVRDQEDCLPRVTPALDIKQRKGYFSYSFRYFLSSPVAHRPTKRKPGCRWFRLCFSRVKSPHKSQPYPCSIAGTIPT